jgi:hypothetical protein
MSGKRWVSRVLAIILLGVLAGCTTSVGPGSSSWAPPRYWYSVPAPHGFSLMGLGLLGAVRNYGTDFRLVRWAYDPRLPGGPGWEVALLGRSNPPSWTHITPQRRAVFATVVQFRHGQPVLNDDVASKVRRFRHILLQTRIIPWGRLRTLPRFGQARIPPLPVRALWWTPRMIQWNLSQQHVPGLGGTQWGRFYWGAVPAGQLFPVGARPFGSTILVIKMHRIPLHASRSQPMYIIMDAASGLILNASPRPPRHAPSRWYLGGLVDHSSP